jgi:hypothetical protein
MAYSGHSISRKSHKTHIINRSSAIPNLHKPTPTDFEPTKTKFETIHETRARSKYLSEDVQRESKVWLVQHEPLTT